MGRTASRIIGAVVLPGLLSGCAGVDGVTDSLNESIAAQRDPALVEAGLPAYVLLADTLARRSPDSASSQFTAARLYSTYAGSFVDDPERKRVLTQQALERARSGLRLALPTVARQLDGRSRDLRETIQTAVTTKAEAHSLYRFTTVWAGWVQARADNYSALTALPKLQTAFKHVLSVAPTIDHGLGQAYMGVLLSQRPASYGGHPERARQYFQRAIAISDDRNLMAKALYAEHYARLVGDRSLHDRLVKAVLQADPKAEGLTLSNELAQQRARHLRASADTAFKGTE